MHRATIAAQYGSRRLILGVATILGLAVTGALSVGCGPAPRSAAETVRALQAAWLDDDPGRLYDLLSAETRGRLDARIAIAIQGLRATDDQETTQTFGASKEELFEMEPRDRFLAFARSRAQSDRQPWIVRVRDEPTDAADEQPTQPDGEPATVAAIPQVVGEIPESAGADSVVVTMRAPDGTEQPLHLVRESDGSMAIDGTVYCGQIGPNRGATGIGWLALIGCLALLLGRRRIGGAA